MIKKINKKVFFGFSLIVSSLLTMLFSFSKRNDLNILSLVTEVPLSSIERVSASDAGGDCCGCGCDVVTVVASSDPAIPGPSGVDMVVLEYIPSVTAATTIYVDYGGGGGCFIAGTKVTLADGTTKNIEDVSEDLLMTSGEPEQVLKRYVISYKGLIYAFNGDGNYFVTPTHPFMTKEGWKSLDPEGTKRESPGIEVSLLSLGDTFIMKDNQTKNLTQLDSKEISATVYNFGVNGTHEFYADDYLVHNVDTANIEGGELARLMLTK